MNFSEGQSHVKSRRIYHIYIVNAACECGSWWRLVTRRKQEQHVSDFFYNRFIKYYATLLSISCHTFFLFFLR